MPFAKARMAMDDGVLGLLLLSLGIGSILAMPLAGALAARLGRRRVIIVSALLMCLTLLLLASASNMPLLIAALLFFGASLGAIDVSMNIQAIIIERERGRPTMSGFHGLFSLGGIVGAAGVTALLGAGASPLTAILVVVIGIAVALATATPHLIRYDGGSNGTVYAVPRGVVFFIGALCFILFLTKGAVLDWSAVFLTSVRNVDASYAGLGYAAFASTMTIGRLSGDKIVQRFGNTKILAFGGICAATGFALTLVPIWPVALLGFALVGVGCSNIIPVLFTSAGRQTVMPESMAVPAIASMGYAGILLGPAGIGLGGADAQSFCGIPDRGVYVGWRCRKRSPRSRWVR